MLQILRSVFRNLPFMYDEKLCYLFDLRVMCELKFIELYQNEIPHNY
jgi:hypothetical protein